MENYDYLCSMEISLGMVVIILHSQLFIIN